MRGPPFVLALILAPGLLLAGCMVDSPQARVDVQVKEARLVEGDCTFGPRDDASDPEWCHVLTVTLRNRHAVDGADVGRTSWAAIGVDGGRYTHPRVTPAGTVAAGTTGNLTLAFAAPAEVRLVTLTYEGTFGGRDEATVPPYASAR